VSHHSDLIDTTEMYLRTVYELEEEGITPLRARIAERLRQSGPTVSQTVARMQRDGLLTVQGDRHLELTVAGREQAVAVMRKHRLAECLLVDIIGLEWEDIHNEACRWEHVMSEAVERRLVSLLDNPTHCPHGNPIPGLGELGAIEPAVEPAMISLRQAADSGETTVVVRRISEQLQPDVTVMHRLTEVGILPGREVQLTAKTSGVRVRCGGQDADLDEYVAQHVYVAGGSVIEDGVEQKDAATAAAAS
jgi:DtxR family transcriptional regulator, iron-dependent repressor